MIFENPRLRNIGSRCNPSIIPSGTVFVYTSTKMKFSLLALASVTASASAFSPSAFAGKAVKSGAHSASSLCMKYKVAVVGGGPSGACAAEIFAQEKGIDTVMFERKLDNAKPCGGAIPLCMVGEFDIPESVVDRKVCCRKAFFHSLFNEDGTGPVSCMVGS